ncbi:PREDICTED: intercellular adhesion molecule 4 [Galeopterus variegatus]|uniref:Intercellular adhesion molecule 4 n=1 Tax=Galeopterus variegatus TaxID=482537 RepID=A0ABM0R6J7_GALVR|nr:PREDICTED: intercellular adhesion molecule 4 [Galeopterus variegatus]
MGSLFLLSLLLLLVADNPGGGSPRGRNSEERVQGSSPPTPSGTSAPFWIGISPELVAVPPGSSVWLNCSNNCPLPEGSRLYTQLQRGKTLSGPGWVYYQLLNVRAWSSDVYCSVTCAGKTLTATARINTYKRPHSVVLEPPVLEGNEYTLRCHVTHVFPVGLLVVTLRSGDKVIYSESLERYTDLHLANVTLTHVLRARPCNLWQPVTCHARLSLDGLVVRSNSAPVMLTPGEVPL